MLHIATFPHINRTSILLSPIWISSHASWVNSFAWYQVGYIVVISCWFAFCERFTSEIVQATAGTVGHQNCKHKKSETGGELGYTIVSGTACCFAFCEHGYTVT